MIQKPTPTTITLFPPQSSKRKQKLKLQVRIPFYLGLNPQQCDFSLIASKGVREWKEGTVMSRRELLRVRDVFILVEC